MVMGDLDIGSRPATLPTKEEIVGVMLQDMEVGPNISTIHPSLMLEKLLMVLGEVDFGLGLDLLPPIIQAIIVDHLFL